MIIRKIHWEGKSLILPKWACRENKSNMYALSSPRGRRWKRMWEGKDISNSKNRSWSWRKGGSEKAKENLWNPRRSLLYYVFVPHLKTCIFRVSYIVPRHLQKLREGWWTWWSYNLQKISSKEEWVKKRLGHIGICHVRYRGSPGKYISLSILASKFRQRTGQMPRKAAFRPTLKRYCGHSFCQCCQRRWQQHLSDLLNPSL